MRRTEDSRIPRLGLVSWPVMILFILSLSHPARAMYWEDDHPSNDPSNQYRKPGGCFWGPLFRGLKKSSRKAKRYLSEGGRPLADRGVVVNRGKKLSVILSSGLLGATTGYIAALATEKDNQDIALYRSVLTTAGFLGGMVVGIFILPETLNVDPHARTPQGVFVALSF